MASTTEQGKLLAKNTAVMYIRMALLTLIYFYTSRVLLRELGEDDFGIYSLVGSVVAMFESIKVLFTASTQRFLSYEMGRQNTQILTQVFNTSLLITLFIAFIFLILVECVGLWFLDYKANIAQERMFAAKFVFQLSLLATVLSILTTPYDASVIAHEKMDFYALMSVTDGVMKLLAVLILPFIPFDRLIFYGIAILGITLLIRITTILYCRRHFSESKFTKSYDRTLLRQMIGFAGWRFVGNASFTVTQNGINMLLNVFGGTVVNAARGISYQVKGAVGMFLNNVTVVVNPYITRCYAKGDKDKMFAIYFFASKIVFILDAIIVIPLLFATDNILNIWLGSAPAYSVIFVQILLLNTLVSALHQQTDVVFMATGKMKIYQICEGILLLLPVILSYFALKAGLPYYSVFLLVMVIEILDVAAISFLAKKTVGLNLREYFCKVILHCVVISLLIVGFWQIGDKFISHNFAIQLIYSVIIDLLCLIYMVYIGFTRKERTDLKNVLSNGKFSFLARFIYCTDSSK